MVFIKQRLKDVLIFDERLELIKEFKSSSFVIVNERVLIKQGEKTLVDLPYQNVAIIS